MKTITRKIRDEDLTVTKADKGYCCVILPRTEYIDKVKKFLTDKILLT